MMSSHVTSTCVSDVTSTNKTNEAMAAVKAYFAGLFQRVLNFRGTSSYGGQQRRKDNMFIKLLSPFESYLVSIQSLLIWERPYLSAVVLLAVNCAYWVIATCSRRLYSFVAVVSLIVFLYRTWVYQIWPEIRVAPPENTDSEGWTPIHPQVLSVPELSQHLNDAWLAMRSWWDALWRLRSQQPGKFCIISCAGFSALAVLGRFVPGMLLVYALVVLATYGPGLALHVLPIECIKNLRVLLYGSGTSEHSGSPSGDTDLDEFLPEGSQASLLSDLTLSENRSSVESHLDSDLESQLIAQELGIESLVQEAREQEESLCQGLGEFPSVEEESEEETMEGVSWPAPSDGGQRLKSSPEGIHFVPTHFKENSSESDNEEAFTQGLSFSSRVPESMESSMCRPLSLSQRSLRSSSTGSITPPPPSTTMARSSQGRLQTQATTQQGTTSTSQTRNSDIDISEYELVSESELSS